MSGWFNGTDSYLLNTSPAITTYPFTVGFWAYWDGATGDRVAWALTSTTGQAYEIALNASSQWVLFAGTSSTTGTPAQANGWTFLLGRFISATNRILFTFHPNGTVFQTQSTTNVTQTVTQMVLGAYYDTAPSQVWSGGIAEFWYMNRDISPATTTMITNTARELKHRGPFSFTPYRSNIVEYRSFQACLSTDEDVLGDVYYGSAGRQTWTKNGGLTLGPHPPLSPTYMRPADFRQLVPV